MPAEIVTRTISGVQDKRVITDNVHPSLVRKMSIGSNWNSIRVMVRIGTNLNSTLASIPPIYIGMCSGVDNVPGDLQVDHFLGLRFRRTYASSGATILTTNSLSNSYPTLVHIQNNSLTVSAVDSSRVSATDVASGDNGNVIGFEITKGSPWTFLGKGQVTNTPRTLSEYKQILDGSLATTTAFTSTEFTPDEATYGYFDTICLINTAMTHQFEISDFGYNRLA